MELNDKNIKNLIIWVLSIFGVIIGYLLWKKDKDNIYWVNITLAFFISAIILNILAGIAVFIPIIGMFISALIGFYILIAWLYGMLLILNNKTTFKLPLFKELIEFITQKIRL
ncbi:MAG: hypothetical protein QXI89_00930 [Candidatus Anstonellales archaeon]